MAAAYNDRELEALFAQMVADSIEFRAWLLSRTKFAKLWRFARLMHVEQKAAKGDAWWHGWSAADQPSSSIFLTFEIEHTNLRFALQIDNAGAAGALQEKQAEDAKARAQAMAHQDAFMNYDDFETVLLAPAAFMEIDLRTRFYDRRIPFESIAGFAPQFNGVQRKAA